MIACGDRLRDAGYGSFADYLRSAAWRAARRRYIAAGLPTECVICAAAPVELHHVTYRRVPGRERPTDLVPLCRAHHRQLHDLREEAPWLTGRRAVTALRRRVRADERRGGA